MNQSKIAIYTAIFGQYDPLKTQVKQNLPVDLICFTDREITHPDWKVITISAEDNPRKQAKLYKLQPHHIAELNEYDFVVWIDGSFVIQRPNFVEWVVSFIGASGWAVFAHYKNNCLYNEAQEMAAVKKYHGARIAEQAAYYKAQNYPKQNGLYMGGLIARDMHNQQWQKICDIWWQENLKWTLRDQISLPYALWKAQGKIDLISANMYDNPYFTVENTHRAHEYDTIDKN